jgi:hypothetical protein
VAAVAAIRRLLALQAHRLRALLPRQLLPLRALLLRQLLLPLILLLLRPPQRPVVAAAVAVAAPLLLLRRTLLQQHRHPLLLRLPHKLRPVDAVDNSAIQTTKRRLDAVPRALVACRRCTMRRGKETLLPFAPCSMVAPTSTRPLSTARLRSPFLFSTPNGTLRWN